MKELFLWQKNHKEGMIWAPVYAGDAGFDLAVAGPTEIMPGKVTKVNCGINIALPDGYVAIMVARSSAVIRGILVLPTLLDSGYRGDIYVFAISVTGEPIAVYLGQRIAQLLLLPNVSGDVALGKVDGLPPSKRGNNGFGSTGGA